MRVLVSTDNFWIGGRETFLSTYLAELKTSGVAADLIASRVSELAARLDLFERHTACGAGSRVGSWKSWIEKGSEMIRDRRPDFIWAQHFELLPAWLLAQMHGLPMLTTFHGPVIGANRPNRLMDAVGMVFAVCRGSMVSGVSAEIEESLRDAARTPIAVIPNAVVWDSNRHAGKPADGRRAVCITRIEKLEHLRAAAKLFSVCRKECGLREMIIAGGTLPGKSFEDNGWPWRGAASARLLGVRWVVEQRLIGSVCRIRYQGPTSDSRQLIAGADIVFGMGRVALESLASCRPTVLIGYDNVVDVIDGDNFDRFAFANFSGRGQPAGSIPEVARKLRDPSNLSPLTNEQTGKYSVVAQAPRLLKMFENVRTTSSSGSDAELARKMANLIIDGVGEEELFNIACEAMSDAERRLLHRFVEG